RCISGHDRAVSGRRHGGLPLVRARRPPERSHSQLSPLRLEDTMKRWVAFLAMWALSAHVPAQNYPERTVRIINTFPAGGSGDAVLRVVFDKVSAALGQPFIQETRTGAGGSIGTEYVAKAAPDGYTLVLGTASTFGTNSATMSKLSY